jgi:copper transport protein
MVMVARAGSRALAALLALCTALGVLLIAAGPANAHAVLRGSAPKDGAVLRTAPHQVALTFSEDVRLPDGALRVLDPHGTRMDRGSPGHVPGKPSTVRAALSGNLPRGTYTVAWRVVSADSHPVSGAFTFSVGAPSATSAGIAAGAPQDTLVGALYGVGRFAAYGGLALLVGGTAFVLLCRPDRAARRRLRRLAVSGWWVLLLSSAALLVLRGPYEAGAGLSRVLRPAAFEEALAGRPGQALATRLVLLAVGAAAWQTTALRRWAAGSGRLRVAAGAGFSVALAATWAVSEHASVGPQAPVAVVSVVAHLLGMAVWLGGLTAVLTLLRGARDASEPPREAVGRFSRLAFTTVAALVATGLYQSWQEVGSWQALVSTSYGRLLAVKVGAVLALLAAAGYSRRWTTVPDPAPRSAAVMAAAASSHTSTTATRTNPGGAVPPGVVVLDVVSSDLPPGDTVPARWAFPGRSLRRSVTAEAVLGLVVLAVTTLLTGTAPARTALDSTADAVRAPSEVGLALADINVRFDTGGQNGKGRANLAIEPGRVGRNSLRVVVFDAHDGLLDPPELKVSLTLPGKGIGPLNVPLDHEGVVWLADDLNVPFPGRWRLAVTVRTSEIDEVTVARTVNVAGAPPAS